MKHKKCPRCPKCGNIPIYYTELWKNSSIDFPVTQSLIEIEGYMNPGVPYKVEAVCSCDHRWTLRGVTQISDLR